jgi:uncharacterized protein
MLIISKDYWKIRQTVNKGYGIFAGKMIPSGTVIGDYTGKLVKLKDVDFDAEKKNMYLMYYSDNRGIYPDLSKPGVHLINHSCRPNAWIKNYKDHTLVFAIKDILEKEEITISYLLPPKTNCNKCTHGCLCNSATCTGTMHLTEEKYKKWRDFIETDKKIKYGTSVKKYLKPLSRYPKHISGDYIRFIKKLNITGD